MEHLFPNGIAVSLSDDAASYSIRFPGGREIPGCRVAAGETADAAPATPLSLSVADGKATLSAETPVGPVSVVLSEAFDGTAPALEFLMSATLAKPLRRVFLSGLADLTLENATHLLSHGRSMGGCKTCKLPAAKLETEPGEKPGAAFESHFQTLVSFADGKLHVTQPLLQTNVASTKGRIDGAVVRGLTAVTVADFPEAGVLEAEPFTVSFVQDGFKALEAWGDAHAAVPPLEGIQPIGWNSWDYYRWTITEEETMKNAEFIASDPVLSQYVKRIIVDDGWQYCYGEWDANPLFPSGMDGLARNLRKMGFTPGVWIAPVVAETHSRIAQWQTDWLAMSEGGDPTLCFDCMRRKGFALDPSLPEVRQWIYDLFTRYADMGYGYFKMDFLWAALRAPRFHNPLPRGQIMRRIVEPIAAATRGRAELLGCGYGYDGGNDLVRMVRAGGDIHATWGNARSNAITIAARYWASNRVWTTDPDFCVCRGPDTSSDPDLGRLRCLYVFVQPDETRRGPSETYPWSNGLDSIRFSEAQVLLSLAICNGGALNLSDKLYVLNDRGLDLVRRTVSAKRGSAPMPVDLFESDVASKWIQPIPGGFRTLLVNWTDAEAELSLDLAAHGLAGTKARDFWTDEEVAIQGGRVSAVLPPRSCQFLEF